MSHLIVNMIGHNEADRYLEIVLKHTRQFADKIIFTDDHSSDETPDIAADYGCEVYLTEDPDVSFTINEGELRAQSWCNMEENVKYPHDTMILMLDCDELLWRYTTMPQLFDQTHYEVLGIPFFHIWESPHYARVDKLWRPNISSRLFRYYPGGEYRPRKLACFAPDTFVRTVNGYEKIQDIKVGDLVLGSEGKFNKVYEVMEQDYSGLIYEIETYGSVEPMIVTPDHPLLAMIGKHVRKDAQNHPCLPWKCEKGKGLNFFGGKFNNQIISHDMIWTPAEKIKQGSWLTYNWPIETHDLNEICIPQKHRLASDNKEYNRNEIMRFDITHDFLWAIGMFLAEGSSGLGGIRYTLHEDEVGYHKRLKYIWEKLGYGVTLYNKKDSKGYEIIVNSRTLGSWMSEWLGKDCYNKQIPSELLNLPNHKIEYLIEGIFDGDATKPGRRKNGEIKQSSYMLSRQLQELLLRLGGKPTISTNPGIDGRVDCAVVSGINYPIDRKRKTWYFEDNLLIQVKSVKSYEYTGKTYNLRVENDPTYTVGSILVHNCGAEPTYVQTLIQQNKILWRTPLLFEHLGYLRAEDKLMKYKRYMEIDGGAFHNRTHIESIVDPSPTLIDISTLCIP